MAKAKKPVDQEQEVKIGVQPFELWDVKVEIKTELDEEYNKIKVPTFQKKGTEPVRTVHIEQRHADIFNEQSANHKQRYYLPQTND